jgi:hypothetical protein
MDARIVDIASEVELSDVIDALQDLSADERSIAAFSRTDPRLGGQPAPALLVTRSALSAGFP